jgi:hypothetical protein
MDIANDIFAMICFIALMQNHDGIYDKAPYYVAEKMVMLKCGADAFAFLDVKNQAVVVAYCENWGIHLPEKVRNAWESNFPSQSKTD